MLCASTNLKKCTEISGANVSGFVCLSSPGSDFSKEREKKKILSKGEVQLFQMLLPLWAEVLKS